MTKYVLAKGILDLIQLGYNAKVLREKFAAMEAEGKNYAAVTAEIEALRKAKLAELDKAVE